MLWENLENTAMNNATIKAIQALHKDSVTKIMIGEYLLKGFIINKDLSKGVDC
jgi:hypothetical protein